MINKSTARVFIVAAVVFISLGMVAAIGPTLPEFAANNNTTLDAVGSIFTAIFLGAIPGGLIAGWLNDRYGPRPVVTGGLLIFGTGLLAATFSPNLPLTLALIVFAGLGDGALVVGANVMAAETFSERSTSVLNLLNVFYGVGAIAGPAIVGLTLSTWGTAMPVLWLLSGMLLLTVLGALTLPSGSHKSRAGEPETAAEPGGRPFFLSPVLWTLSLVLLLYVGVEVGTGGWVSTYMQNTTNLVPETAAFVASAFYLSLTAGRLAGAGLGTRLRAEQLMLYSLLATAASGIFLLLVVGNPTLTIAAVVAMGASVGPVYPTILAIVSGRFPHATGKAASIVMTAGSLGGTIFPWLMGVLIVGQGPERFPQMVVAITATMVAVFGATLIAIRRRAQARELAAAQYVTTTKM